MLSRRAQTNELARCATLLSARAGLSQPLALLEVGASAELTLLPDRYSYGFAGHLLRAPDPAAPVLCCRPEGPVPLPDIAWRAGLDLNPLDVCDEDDVAWLWCLVWPGEPGREERRAAAVAIARHDPPRLVRGELVDDLAALAAQAPRDATLVVFHTAVLAYVPASRRRDFAATVTDLGAVWLANGHPDATHGLTNPPRPSAAHRLRRPHPRPPHPPRFTDSHRT
jgi:hypothetical protein